MMDTRIHLVALPLDVWREQTLAALVADALVGERRIRKGSNLEIERARYRLSCQHIETWALQWMTGARDVTVHTLDAHYLDVLDVLLALAEKQSRAQALAAQARLGATFYPPDRIAQHVRAFDELVRIAGLENDPVIVSRKAFLESLLSIRSDDDEAAFGVVEIQSAFQPARTLHPPSSLVSTPLSKGERTGMLDSPQAATGDEACRNSFEALRNEIRQALSDGGEVNFSNPPHRVITEVLHEFVYRREGEAETSIRVVYSDGSEAEPFPLRCLRRRPPEDMQRLLALPLLRAALLSMRHLDMDAKVDMAWFLNQEASRSRPYAETDAFCYERTLQQLEQLKGPVRLDLYQTGLQPAVVGFYRALVRWLQERQSEPPRLVVVPRYYHKSGRYLQGRPWG